MPDSETVEGTIILPDRDVPPMRTTVVVQVEDVSRADAPSRVIAELVKHGVRIQNGTTIPFELEVSRDAVEDRNSYSVRVHVDVSGSGKVEVGDFVSTQSLPVLTRGAGRQVIVKVKEV